MRKASISVEIFSARFLVSRGQWKVPESGAYLRSRIDRDHDHGSDDVIVIEDFLFRELSYAGREHGGAAARSLSIHEFSLPSEVGIVQ